MKIKKVKIRNFRSIKSLDVNFLPYMVFLGKNNSGKSNIMKALEVYFNASPEKIDFRKEDGKYTQTFSITIYFIDLSQAEKEVYKGNLFNEGKEIEELILRYTVKLDEERKVIADTKYECMKQTLDLNSEEVQKRYGGMFEKNIYRSKNKIQEHEHIPEDFKKMAETFLEEKESSNRFSKKGFRSLRNEYVQKILDENPGLSADKFIEISISSRSPEKHLGNYFFIPAVQDIEKETSYTARGKRNLNQLMNYVLEQVQDPELRLKKEKDIQKILKNIYRIGQEDSVINQLKEELNEQLQTFDNSSISFDTELPNLSRLIRNSLKIIIDDGIKTEVQYKGHGLQRYFMVILFKVWAEKLRTIREEERKRRKSVKNISTSTFFAIEEPELFLHPQFQRMMRIYLQNIAEDEGHQVILNTHSPHFIEFNNIYQVAKVIKPTLGVGTKVIQPLEFTEEGEIKEKELVCVWGNERQKEFFKHINRVNMNYYLNPNRNEMFFADKVVLVEGQTEKMMFQAWANYFFGEDISLISQVSYIDCLGKFNFQHYIRILNEFQIPFVVVVDSDVHKSAQTRRMNQYIKDDAFAANGLYFELEPDFEGQFSIVNPEVDLETGEKRHKPYHAFNQFFEPDGSPKEEEIEQLQKNGKLQSIFRAIYGRIDF
jgi:putative ATP-dependent endonuclease of the OLD family